ncbi:hypothetical protein KSP39_PZI000509 [Platanthera zijinensis]|uniref:Bifunctional inhibitor/plant lipid transfer protein/seed storage helical domain-containing protein n=1 Tax=Platanthera zijinensis TaxID=2320716 RepID=A0AAP0GGB5_9ASPA
MAQAATKMLMAAAVLLLAASLWFPAAGQSGCTTALISLAPCLNYISGNSTIPSSTCCSQLGGVVQSEPQCLCTRFCTTSGKFRDTKLF